MSLGYNVHTDGAARYTPNFAPASYARSSAATTAFPDNRTHRSNERIWPAVPRSASNAVGFAAEFASDGWDFNEIEGKEGLETIDRLAQHCTFVRQQIELLISRLDDKIGDLDYQRHTGGTCSCAATAREKRLQEEKTAGQWMSDVKHLVGQTQQQLQRTQAISDSLVRMDAHSWGPKTQQLELAVNSLKEDMREFKVKQRQDGKERSKKVAEERELKQSQDADRDKQMEDVIRRLKELEKQRDVEEVEEGEQDDGQDEREWFFVNQHVMNARRRVEFEDEEQS